MGGESKNSAGGDPGETAQEKITVGNSLVTRHPPASAPTALTSARARI